MQALTNETNPRQVRGYAIVAKGSQIRRIDSQTYRVKSQASKGSYLVFKQDSEWACECPDHKYRGVMCKHIFAVFFSLEMRKEVSSSDEVFQLRKKNLGVSDCQICGSPNVMKFGTRKIKKGKVQRFKCKDCGHRFTVNEAGFEKIQVDPKIVTLALDLYFKGVSLRKVTNHLKQFYDLEVSHVTIYNWIQKYVSLINQYLETLTPQLGEQWHVDEMKVKANGQWLWLWNIMDADTRFLLSSLVSKKREVKDARRIFQKAKEIAKTKPEVVVSDGLRSYTRAFKKEFYTMRKPRTMHIQKPRFVDLTNNNIVERLNGTVREREKVMRGTKEEVQTIADGVRNYYNFIRPHQSLDGKTPAEVANINLNLGKNKWLSLIRQASKSAPKT
jgi:putative transposase